MRTTHYLWIALGLISVGAFIWEKRQFAFEPQLALFVLDFVIAIGLISLSQRRLLAFFALPIVIFANSEILMALFAFTAWKINGFAP